jgi:hypothetical protein
MNVNSAIGAKSIFYASIHSVRLDKGKWLFKTIITIEGEKSIEVTNRFYLADGSYEDRSPQYETFLRVLHFHLKEKSLAEFHTGHSWGQLLFTVSTCILLAVSISSILCFFKINFVDLITQSFLLATLFLGFIFAAGWPNLPKVYHPNQIPRHFLP